ncbi:unnamed protein product [Paramecium sonneborni]|uniref:Uncharacterized protein n=1 Tax=Paramecium sonneborni TaxID=65129 RepID=A0A8S1QNS5_9CILI|nr:unnamed protein product [Paramecium sonneborni]
MQIGEDGIFWNDLLFEGQNKFTKLIILQVYIVISSKDKIEGVKRKTNVKEQLEFNYQFQERFKAGKNLVYEIEWPKKQKINTWIYTKARRQFILLSIKIF